MAMKGSADTEPTTVEQLGTNGTLPPGVHDASMLEVEAQFGGSIRRRMLIAALRRLVQLARRCEFVFEIYIDGSFVTAKTEPNDIDIVLGIEDLPLPPEPLNVHERTLRLRSLRRCGSGVLHTFAFPHTDWRFQDIIDHFCKEREEAGGAAKGIVRLVRWRNDE
jgi:hypothetical protein